MRTVTLNLKQIAMIFVAGCNRGQNEACAYEWGCSPSGKRGDDLIDALVDAINDQGNIHDVTFSEVKKWFEDAKL